VFVAVVNGVIAAPFLLIVMLVSNNRAIMGEHVNNRTARTLGWAATALMTGAAVALFATGGGL
jgi:Mn2+/Fe2+ NRAMP family transporter